MVLASALLMLLGAVNAVPTPLVKRDCPTTTISFVAHQDDDLLFMNPDVASDQQAGYCVWVVYLTAGNVQKYDAMTYANQRVEGARAAHARASQVNNSWTYDELSFNGHTLASDTLDGTDTRLVFTYMPAADGALTYLSQMYNNPALVLNPIDGRPGYNQSDFVATLQALVQYVNPDYIRVQNLQNLDTSVDHIDHLYGAQLANMASQGYTVYSYIDYPIDSMPANVLDPYWVAEKGDIYAAYAAYDVEVQEAGGRIYWKDDRSVMAQEYQYIPQ
ncbi:hypothetical protein HDV06_005827 [Boothiomyces sp. JEL0866]|nr:hypothetical protein HDV06_005827 [Boothiomyces sp. JEL0866]